MGEKRYYEWNGNRLEIGAPHLSDFEVACKVRMLMRDQLNHESICTTARDRIMCLASERDTALSRAAELEKLANTALDELHQLNVAFNFARLSMDEQSRKIAGEIASDAQTFITKSRAGLSPKEGV